MSESLWGPEETPKVKKFRTRKAQPMAAVTPIIQEQPVFAKPIFKAREAPRDWPMEDAIRVLAASGILHPNELATHGDVLHPSPDAQAGIAEWRSRNGLA